MRPPNMIMTGDNHTRLVVFALSDEIAGIQYDIARLTQTLAGISESINDLTQLVYKIEKAYMKEIQNDA